MKQVYQKGRTHKFSQKKDQNTCIRADLNRKVGKKISVKQKVQISFQQ